MRAFSLRVQHAALAAMICGAACGGGQKTAEPSKAPTHSPPPAIPATIASHNIAPLTGHTVDAKSPLLDIMAAENRRSMAALAAERPAAFFLGYTIREEQAISIDGEGGGLTRDDEQTARSLDVEVRVGSPSFDNRHMLANDRLAPFQFIARHARVPFGTDAQAIRNALWLETDRRYREGALMLRNLKTQSGLRAVNEKSPDFAFEPPSTYIQPKASFDLDRDKWRGIIRSCSKQARRGIATRSGCSLDISIVTQYYVNSEGAMVQTSWPTARFAVSVGIKADDGMPLSRVEDRFVRTPQELPSATEIATMIKRVTDDLDALHKAPVVDPYVGPAILEGRAAAVFFHEVFGHRIEGHRQKDPNFGKTFTAEIGNRIMPEWLSVYDDPTIDKVNGLEVNGFYRFDDEGVQARKVSLVENGVLKGFLQGRSPLAGFPMSNGHGRRSSGLPAVSRQGNLIVSSARSVTESELRARLIEKIKASGKPFGMIFTDISGGYTNTSKFGAQSFKVLPTMAYRLYANGRQELVRGVDIVGTPLTVLAAIESASRPTMVFNGMCGAESGWVPVSAAAPGLLLDKIEVERGFKPTNSPPVLGAPRVTNTAGKRGHQ